MLDASFIINDEVAYEPTDRRQLRPMARATKGSSNLVTLTGEADKGSTTAKMPVLASATGSSPAYSPSAIRNQHDVTPFNRLHLRD